MEFMQKLENILHKHDSAGKRDPQGQSQGQEQAKPPCVASLDLMMVLIDSDVDELKSKLSSAVNPGNPLDSLFYLGEARELVTVLHERLTMLELVMNEEGKRKIAEAKSLLDQIGDVISTASHECAREAFLSGNIYDLVTCVSKKLGDYRSLLEKFRKLVETLPMYVKAPP